MDILPESQAFFAGKEEKAGWQPVENIASS